MSDKVDVNKLSDKDKRRAEHIADNLEDQGLGQDHAKKEARRQVLDERGGSAGGSSAAADAPKHANHENDHRLGSDKQHHSG